MRVATIGPVEVVELAAPEDDDATAFLAGLYAAIGCRSVECVELTTTCDMWLDENGMVDGRALNHRATLLAQSYALSVRVFGDVVVTGANDDLGQTVGLTDDQVEGIVRHIRGLAASGELGIRANLRYLLNAWDPIGVADAVDDEYDCLIGPLLRRLAAGGSQAEISEFLWTELEDHFGLDPGPRDVDKIANQLVTWWSAHTPD